MCIACLLGGLVIRYDERALFKEYFMKFSKTLLAGLLIAQTVLLVGHWLLYSMLLYFFPQLIPYKILLWCILTIFAMSFTFFSMVSFRYQGPIVRAGYIGSAIWMLVWFYSSLAAVATLVISLFAPVNVAFVGVLTLFVAFIMCIYGIINARIIRVTRTQVKLENLPDFWKGKKAVVVSDIHLGHVLRYGFAGNVIAKVNQLKPDIVFIPGDFFDGVKTNFHDLANLFAGILSPHGIFYVTGNHELIAGVDVCKTALKTAGIKVLEDEIKTVEGLQIAGIEYAEETEESLRSKIAKLGLQKDVPSILLRHVPNLVHVSAEAGVSLQFSGHTHLGQVWPGSLITRRIFKGFDYGLKQLGNLQVFTSSGVGTWGPPVRVFTKAEIVEVTFI